MTEQSGHKAMTEIRRLRLEAEAYTTDAPAEDDFWAQERARAVAERGQQADPSACGTCRDRVAAGGQVKHDECAQRATLLPAPDAPGYELITGMSEEEVRALPPRFHTPVFMDSCTPTMWVCAVCWGEGWGAQWPCPTAYEHGTKVFTPEHQAETAAKKQAAELEHLRKERDAFRDQRNAVFQTNQRLIGEVEAAGQARLHAENQTRTVTRTVEELRGRVAELEAELAKYVGNEPTVAEEMAYLSRRLHTVHDLCDLARQRDRGTVTVAELELSVNGEWQSPTPRPALPWAHAMDDSDLQMFLDDLVGAAMGRWRSDPELSARQVLADVEKACADWRTPGQGLRSDEPAAGEAR